MVLIGFFKATQKEEKIDWLVEREGKLGVENIEMQLVWVEFGLDGGGFHFRPFADFQNLFGISQCIVQHSHLDQKKITSIVMP